MNDLMTNSFISYVELKKQAMKDLKSECDLEAGGLTRTNEENLAQFFKGVGAIQSEMESISNLLLDLQHLNEETRSAHSHKVIRGLRDRIEADMVAILRKAKVIKGRLEALDRSNIANRSLSVEYKESSPIDRTRISVTNGLRTKLREIMNNFQSLREQIIAEHKEVLKRRYYNATGEVANEEIIEKMFLGGGQVEVFARKVELDLENRERQKAVSDIQRSLLQLHQVFLDMEVMVEAQGDQLNNIEDNVVRAGDYISGGTDRLASANALKKKKNRKWILWVWGLVLILFLVCLIPIITGS